jgi:hypothetical protein
MLLKTETVERDDFLCIFEKRAGSADMEVHAGARQTMSRHDGSVARR